LVVQVEERQGVWKEKVKLGEQYTPGTFFDGTTTSSTCKRRASRRRRKTEGGFWEKEKKGKKKVQRNVVVNGRPTRGKGGTRGKLRRGEESEMKPGRERCFQLF